MALNVLLKPLQNQFDMVVSAYTLLDQPDKKKRYEVVDSLWRMTADVLVSTELVRTVRFGLKGISDS